MEFLLVITNMPDRESAKGLAEALVSARLAACVNILAPCTSVYRWKGEIETAEEIPLLIKTPAAQYGKVEAAILSRHPYELPKIIAVPISTGLPQYLSWLSTETNEIKNEE